MHAIESRSTTIPITMELKDFVKKVVMDLVESVDEASQESSRSVKLLSQHDKRTIEFDIAITTEDVDTKSGKAGVKVLQFVKAGGDMSKELKNAAVSRISFGIDVCTITKAEAEQERREFEQSLSPTRYE